MREVIYGLVSGLPDWLATIILAAVPITELQLAIPFAIHKLDMLPLSAYFFAVLGNAIPFFPLYFGLDKLRDVLARYVPWSTKPIDAFIRRAERKLGPDYEKFGALALFLFIWIPFPFTGVWTATAAAVALKIDFKRSVLGIMTGKMTSGIIVTLLSVAAGAV